MTSGQLVTKEGLKRLNDALNDLKNIQRPSVIQDIAEARSHGDLKENSEYTAAKEKQALIEGKINELEQLIMNAEPFEPSAVVNVNEVRFGAKCILVGVDIKEEKHIQIVSSMEADISKGLIAIDAPIAKVLLGKHLNDKVEIMSRGVKQAFKISKIQY